MALGAITRNTSNSQATSDASVGSLKVTNTDIVGDSSYPTGGSTLTPAQLGLGTVVFTITSLKANGTGTNPATDAYYDIPNQKLKTFGASAETPSTTNLSASIFQVTAFGY
jgi:hypothetical protein